MKSDLKDGITKKVFSQQLRNKFTPPITWLDVARCVVRVVVVTYAKNTLVLIVVYAQSKKAAVIV